MSYTIIGTWRMSLDGALRAYPLLARGKDVAGALEAAVSEIEDNPAYSSVGYGGAKWSLTPPKWMAIHSALAL